MTKNSQAQDSRKYDFYSKNQIGEGVLKDIYIKDKASELSSFLKQQLNYKGLYVEPSFKNKKGVIDIVECSYEPMFDIGIQIKGNQYRYFINALYDDKSDNANKLRENLAGELLAKGFWFHSTTPTYRSKTYKTFCGYKPGFIYRYLTFESLFNKENLEDVTYEEIAAFVKKDIKQLYSNLPQILEISEKHLKEYKPN